MAASTAAKDEKIKARPGEYHLRSTLFTQRQRPLPPVVFDFANTARP